VYGTEERSGGILHSGNPSCVEGGDVEQVCSNLETNLWCLRLLTLSSLSLCLILYLALLSLSYLYMLDIPLCLIVICLRGIVVNTSIQPREPTRHLNPFKGNLEELVQSLARGIRQHS